MESCRYENYNHLRRSLSLSMNTFFYKKSPLENGSVLQKSLSVNIHKVKLQMKLGKIAFSRISGVFCHPPTFLSPVKKGSDFDSAEAVGGVGGELLHTPRVAMATPRKAGTENIFN